MEECPALKVNSGIKAGLAETELRKSASNSLFRNILPASHFESRFCEDEMASRLHNLHGINILAISS
jgi:hypothetical protein